MYERGPWPQPLGLVLTPTLKLGLGPGGLGLESSAPIPRGVQLWVSSRVPQVISVFLHPTWWPGSLGALRKSSLNVGRGTQPSVTLQLRRLRQWGCPNLLHGSLILVPMPWRGESSLCCPSPGRPPYRHMFPRVSQGEKILGEQVTGRITPEKSWGFCQLTEEWDYLQEGSQSGSPSQG